jgi:hypothetical protein
MAPDSGAVEYDCAGARDVGDGPATTVQRAMTRPRRDARPYHRSGEHIITKALPFLVERVGDATVPDHALTPLERTVRGWRAEILDDLGGDTVSAAKRAVLDAAVGSKIILSSLDAFLFQLASSGQGMGKSTPGGVRTPLDPGQCAVCGRPPTGRRPQRVCSPRCRIARWRQTRALETAGEIARYQAENTALRQRVAELERLVGRLKERLWGTG